MTLTEEQFKNALLEQREYMEGLIVKSHDGRMGSMSELFRDLSVKLNARMDEQDEKIDAQNEKMTSLAESFKPFTEGLLAGKLSSKAVLWVAGGFATIGGSILVAQKLFGQH